MREKTTKTRRVAVVCIVIFLFGLLAADLVKIQIIDGKEYARIVSSVSSRTAPILAARGEILDSDGNRLVYNEQGYSVVFDGAYFPPEKEQDSRNDIIISLIRMFEARKLEWRNDLPLEMKDGKVAYIEGSDALIKEMKSREMLNLNDYATAQNCFDALVKQFSLESYEKNDALKVASVLYGMMRIGFGNGISYTFADDVPEETVSAIMENSVFFRGVDAQVVPVRTFADGTIAPHIIGMTGAIDAEEYADLKSKGYRMDAYVGKSGIESAMESYLKGTDGTRTIFTDEEGNRNSEITEEPVQGNTVVLTIQSGMQKVAQNALREALEDYSGKIGNMVPNAGAVVVLSCRDSAVLASATYPTYDISTYAENAA